ncbi:manganese efflux pump [Candidatus Riflebacteria bacterium]
MIFFTIILLAIGLSMDTFAASVALGTHYPERILKMVLRVPLVFALIQGLMPLIGLILSPYLGNVLPWNKEFIAAIILAVVGIKMLWDGHYQRKKITDSAVISYALIVLLALATSVDAFTVGFCFGLLNYPKILTVFTIFCVTFLFSCTGIIFGQKLAYWAEHRANMMGGFILISLSLWLFFGPAKNLSSFKNTLLDLASRTKGISLTIPESTPVIRGEKLAIALGCLNCHYIGRKGLYNPGSLHENIPPFDKGTGVMYIKDETDIARWITYGSSGKLYGSMADVAAFKKPLIPMPAYRNLVTKEELNDLVAYFKAVSWWAPKIPDNAYEGKKFACDIGCFGCHTLTGLGGAPSPGSQFNQIPPWDGQLFGLLVCDDAELGEWIMEGLSKRLMKNPAHRKSYAKQLVKMPSYKEHLSEMQLKKIIAYINWLRGKEKGKKVTAPN